MVMSFFTSCGLNFIKLFKTTEKKFFAFYNYSLDLILDREKIVKDLKDLKFAEIYKILDGHIRRNSNHFYVFSYKNPKVKDLVWQLKFNSNKFPARIFGEALANVVSYFWKEIIDKKITGQLSDRKIILIPIPIHRKRRAERGYNQTEWICEELIKNLPSKIRGQINYDKSILLRGKYTPKQSWVNRKERIKNIIGVFKIKKKNLHRLKLAKIILLDDVYTTGATMKEARRKLLACGVRNVYFITVAS